MSGPHSPGRAAREAAKTAGHAAWRAYEAKDAQLSGLDPLPDDWYWERAPDAERGRWEAAAQAAIAWREFVDGQKGASR